MFIKKSVYKYAQNIDSVLYLILYEIPLVTLKDYFQKNVDKLTRGRVV
jgi:hypothetical protein